LKRHKLPQPVKSMAEMLSTVSALLAELPNRSPTASLANAM